MAVTKIYLIRHAEAEGNLYRRIHGWYDSLITENGYRQIAALEERFRQIPVDAVYSSDLFRTKATAAAIYKPKGLELNSRHALREINMGVWEDLTWGEAERLDPEQMRRFNTNNSAYSCAESETFAQLRERVSRAILSIAAHHSGKTVAVFSHGMAICNVLAHFQGIPPEQTREKIPHGDNTSVSLLEIDCGKMDVKFINDNSHLSEDISTFARQAWWRNTDSAGDVNLWFRPLDMAHESKFYCDAMEEAWMNIHGSILHYNGDAFLRDATEHAKLDERSVLQVMLDDRPAGLLQLNMRRDAEKGVGSIPFLYLLPEHRNKGLGVQLIGQAVSVYRSMGRKYLRLRCAPDNHTAQRFYRRHGFKKIGEAPGARVPLDILEKYIGFDW